VSYEEPVMKARRFLALAILTICSSFAWAADGMKPSEMKTKETLHAVISNQLAAFRADDYAAAYVFADREIKTRMPLESFERMVRAGYPIIAHSISAKFGLTFDNGDEAVVNVRVHGQDEEALSYQYLLRRDGESWRISGVVLLKEQTTEV
jgi:hypothetical protein